MRSPIALLNTSLKMFIGNVKLLLLVFIVPSIVSIIIPFFFITDFNEVIVWDGRIIAELAASMLLLSIINVLLTIAVTKAVTSPESTTVKSAYAFAQKYFIPYLLVAVLTGAIVIVGFFLLIIPGIIFMIWYAFSAYTVLFEDKKGMDALRSSKKYVEGKWMAIFGRLAFLFFVIIVIAMITSAVVGSDINSPENLLSLVASQVINFVMMPVSIAYTYLLYLDAKSASLTPSVPDAVAPAVPQQ